MKIKSLILKKKANKLCAWGSIPSPTIQPLHFYARALGHLDDAFGAS